MGDNFFRVTVKLSILTDLNQDKVKELVENGINMACSYLEGEKMETTYKLEIS